MKNALIDKTSLMVVNWEEAEDILRSESKILILEEQTLVDYNSERKYHFNYYLMHVNNVDEYFSKNTYLVDVSTIHALIDRPYPLFVYEKDCDSIKKIELHYFDKKYQVIIRRKNLQFEQVKESQECIFDVLYQLVSIKNQYGNTVFYSRDDYVNKVLSKINN